MTTLYLYRSLIVKETERAILVRFPKKSEYNYMGTWIPKKRVTVINSHESTLLIRAEQFIELFKGVDSYARKELDIQATEEQEELDFISLKAIRELIFDNNFDSAKLARDTGISRQTLISLHKKERPLSNVKLETLIKMQKYIYSKGRKG